MNSSSESFLLDEHLARLLAAYDQGVEGGDAGAATIHVPKIAPLPGERAVTPFDPAEPNVGSLGELLPDPGRGRPAPATTPPPKAVGGPHRIGRFELRRQLGKGGCGIVFLAYDPKLEREVALKIPRPEMLLSPDARRRLVREALAAAEFDHPNLVPVYETGEIGPVCFIATAFCPGLTLGEWLDRQAFPVPVRQAARLVATVAEAVQHAHDRGVLHRDLKPNNVILQPTKDDPEEQDAPPGSVPLRGEHYVPRVVDFGLAKLIERGGPSETGTRQILGTPKYMAPEQAQARHDDIGPAADVYALGVILYEMVTGRAPYEGATDVEVLRLAIEGNFTAPRHVRPDVPRDLEAICLKAMDPVPGRRYRTAIDLSDDLRRFLDDKPTLARPLKWHGRAARWLRRNDQAVALAVVTTIATVLLALGSWSMRQTRQLTTDRNNVQLALAARDRTDLRRDYAKAVRAAFLAWRAGDRKSAAELLETARRAAGVEPTDFAHDYLAGLIAADRLFIVCPAGPVTALAVTPDGKRLASGHADGTVAVWDRATGEQLGSVPGIGRPVTHLVFALDGTRLVSTTGGVFCREVAPNGSLSSGDTGHSSYGQVTCLAVTADGKTVYAGTAGGKAFRIDPSRPFPDPAGRPVELIPGDAVTAISTSPRGKVVLFGTASGRVVRCDADLRTPPGLELTRGSGPGISVLAGADDDDHHFLLGTTNGNFGCTRPGCGVRSPSPPQIFSPIRWIAAAGGEDATNWGYGHVRFGDEAPRLLPTGDSGPVLAGVATRDQKTLFTAGDDCIIRSWNLPGDLRTFATWYRGVSPSAVGVHPEGTRFGLGSWGEATDHEYTERQERVRFNEDAETYAVRVPKDGPAVAAYPDGRAVAVRAVRRDAKAIVFPVPDGATPIAADLTPGIERLAAGDDRGRIHVWDVAARKLAASIETGHRRPIPRVSLSDDGRTVAASVTDGVGVWVVGDQAPLATVTGTETAVFRLSPDGDRLVTAGRSGVVRVWNVPSGREEFALRGHVGRVTGVAVSPDGRTLVSGGATGDVKFWDLRTGEELISLRRHSGPVTAVEFSANGKTLVTAGTQVAVWECRP